MCRVPLPAIYRSLDSSRKKRDLLCRWLIPIILSDYGKSPHFMGSKKEISHYAHQILRQLLSLHEQQRQVQDCLKPNQSLLYCYCVNRHAYYFTVMHAKINEYTFTLWERKAPKNVTTEAARHAASLMYPRLNRTHNCQ